MLIYNIFNFDFPCLDFVFCSNFLGKQLIRLVVFEVNKTLEVDALSDLKFSDIASSFTC